MRFAPGRRRFLVAGAVVGGGLLLGYGLAKPRDLLGPADVLPVGDGEIALNAWLKIARDGRVTIAVPRAEMGQGIYTALPALVAEELEVDWREVEVVQAPIAPVYANILAVVDTAPLDPDDHGALARGVRWSLARAARVLAVQVTGGSTSVRDAWLPMRSAGAAARDMLIRAAAARLAVPVTELRARAGQVAHEASGRVLAYGALAEEAARLAPPDTIALKAPAQWRLLGTPLPRLDVPSKTDGSARFGIDVHADGMLHAAIAISPVFGGRLTTFDRAALEARPGVVAVVPMDDALAVVADSWWRAQQALDAGNIEFAGGAETASDSGIFAEYAAALDRGAISDYESRGDAAAELAGTDVISAEYRVPALAHACMEPMNCTARITEGAAEIWCGNQAPDLLRLIAARALDLEPARVTLHTPLLGGGFGRRAEPDVMLYALAVARALPGRTVKLIYARTQDLQHDTYRPPALSRFRARLDRDGRIHAWHNVIATPSVSRAVIGRAFPDLPLAGPDKTNAEGAAHLPYAVPHRLVAHARVPIALPVGFWRSVGHSFNAFFTESFIDELALSAGRDPLEFRLAHLRERSRHAHVLELLRELSHWNDPPAVGHARGVALHESFHSIVGQVAEVTLVDGILRVPRVTCVIDCGQVVNPDTVIAQMESGIVFGLGAALYGEIGYEAGRVRQQNFTDYRMLGPAECPRIDTHVVVSGAAPGGVGEPGTPPIAPAVANALARLTGERRRSLPLIES